MCWQCGLGGKLECKWKTAETHFHLPNWSPVLLICRSEASPPITTTFSSSSSSASLRSATCLFAKCSYNPPKLLPHLNHDPRMWICQCLYSSKPYLCLRFGPQMLHKAPNLRPGVTLQTFEKRLGRPVVSSTCPMQETSLVFISGKWWARGGAGPAGGRNNEWSKPPTPTPTRKRS